MPVIARQGRKAAVNLVRFIGAVTPADLDTLLAFYAAQGGSAARCDEILRFEPGCDLSVLTEADLLAFKSALERIVRIAKAPMVVCTALVCESEACRPVVEAWAMLAQADKTLLTETRLMPDMAAAAAWLGLAADAPDLSEAA